eukprot:TRINITY_DN60274_c0_g1_i2.p1 TRINITY_DN60274_c0_g1~~TRINITY_DN60274_c0_g1_i2.p1  ORF type:complete len:138 (-),score=13.92 TRINITY_DN60274_c0_g1_i2:92-505(-)
MLARGFGRENSAAAGQELHHRLVLLQWLWVFTLVVGLLLLARLAPSVYRGLRDLARTIECHALFLQHLPLPLHARRGIPPLAIETTQFQIRRHHSMSRNYPFAPPHHPTDGPRAPSRLLGNSAIGCLLYTSPSPRDS